MIAHTSTPTRTSRKKISLRIFACLLVGDYVTVGLYFWSGQNYMIFKPLRAIERVPSVPYETVSIPIRESAVHGFWLPSTEADPVILYLHGQNANVGKNLHHAECLQQLGCNVLVIDYRGFGETFGVIEPTEASVYRDAEAAWDYLIETRNFAPQRILI
ncbi:MAG: hypothetical protein P8J33_10860 [Pirellulaceae bacterium]|nr:hypothetical protein [Pirellulaceae bacterium]